jgi:large subunit ribosomal protein L18
MSRVKDIAKKNALRLKRKRRIRGKISGTAEKPRVSVYKSNKYFYAQAIDDVAGNTLASINSKALNLSVNKENVVTVGVEFAKLLQQKGIETVVFDRNGYLYHGVVKVFADTLRENGIKL